MDQKELRALADKCERQGKEVIRVSAQGKKADVIVDPDLGTITYGPGASPRPMDMPLRARGQRCGRTGYRLEVGGATRPGALESRICPSLPTALRLPPTTTVLPSSTTPTTPTRRERSTRWNPLRSLRRSESSAGGCHAGNGGAWPVQVERNSQLAASAVKAGGTLVVVGRTNRKALFKGAGGIADVFDTRGDAVTHALQIAGDQGVILYENDLPDHYP